MKGICGVLTVILLAGFGPLHGAEAAPIDSGGKLSKASVKQPPPGCDISRITICTIEIWLAYKHKKNKKEIRAFLKSKSIKVLHHTVQFWKPRGGHPPTNIAIGCGLCAEDALFAIDLALKYNDRIEQLVLQYLNPSNYVAIATSAWDEGKLIPITEKDLKRLRDPKLNTEAFHKLYRRLTGEKDIPNEFY
ncbi:MAG: hypothetical protein ACE5GQ_02765 [Nitrospinales bacterium]